MANFLEIRKVKVNEAALTTAEALSQCRITTEEFNAVAGENGAGSHAVNLAMASAVAHVEEYTGRAFDAADYVASFPLANVLEIPRPHFKALKRVFYIDKDGAEKAFSTSDYLLDNGADFARLYLKHSPDDTADIAAPVRVEFETEKSTHSGLKAAVLIAVDIYYNESSGGDFESLNKLLNLYKIAEI